MRDQIASEFRKLTTTRSVYAMLAGLVLAAATGHRDGHLEFWESGLGTCPRLTMVGAGQH